MECRQVIVFFARTSVLRQETGMRSNDFFRRILFPFFLSGLTLMGCQRVHPTPKSPISPPPITTQKALTIGDWLRLRATPSLTGQEIDQLPRGTVVEVLGRSQEMTTIGDQTDAWVQVRTGTHVGWCFGGFLSFSFQSSPDGKFKSWSTIDPKSQMVKVALFWAGQNKLSEIVHEMTCAWTAFSPSYQYLAVDTGTDIVRSLSFYDTSTGQKIGEYSYVGSDRKWEGETLKFKQVTHVGGCVLWLMVEFREGTFYEVPQTTGQEPYHQMGIKDPLCQKAQGDA